MNDEIHDDSRRMLQSSEICFASIYIIGLLIQFLIIFLASEMPLPNILRFFH